MDQAQLQAKISEYYQKLPQEAQVAFSSMKWMEQLEGLKSKYALSEEQIASLSTETTLALLGIVDIDEYEHTILTTLGTEGTVTTAIVDDIKSNILAPLRTSLENAYMSNVLDMNEEEQENLPPIPPQEAQDEDVPVPPESKKVITETVLTAHEALPKPGSMSKDDKKVLANAGIEMMDDTRASIVANKLAAISAQSQKTSDYTLPKMSGEKNRPSVDSLSRKTDPYKEVIE